MRGGIGDRGSVIDGAADVRRVLRRAGGIVTGIDARDVEHRNAFVELLPVDRLDGLGVECGIMVLLSTVGIDKIDVRSTAVEGAVHRSVGSTDTLDELFWIAVVPARKRSAIGSRGRNVVNGIGQCISPRGAQRVEAQSGSGRAISKSIVPCGMSRADHERGDERNIAVDAREMRKAVCV